MKKFIIAALVLSSFVLYASFSSANPQLEYDHCSSWSELAEQIMINRQVGVPLSDTFAAAGSIAAIEALVIIAYNTPRFHDEAEAQDVVDSFRDRVFYECMKHIRSKRTAL